MAATFGGAVVEFGDHARDALLAERHQHSPAHHRRHPVRNAVGEDDVERTGHGDVAEFGHIVENGDSVQLGRLLRRISPARPNHANSGGRCHLERQEFYKPVTVR